MAASASESPQDQSIQDIREGLRIALGMDFSRARLFHDLSEEDRKLFPFSSFIIGNVSEYSYKLYHCWPGVGMTETVKQLAELSGSTSVTLVLGLSHKTFENVDMGEEWLRFANKWMTRPTQPSPSPFSDYSAETSKSFAFLSSDFISISRFEASPLPWQVSW